LGKPEPTPYHKIGHDPQAIENLLIDLSNIDASAGAVEEVARIASVGGRISRRRIFL
jgi:hypothetical protein